MSVLKPNHLHYESDEKRFSAPFGHFYDAKVVNGDGGPGHIPYMRVRFQHGLAQELTRQDTVRLIYELQMKLATWPEPRGENI